ncbi:hypothetical protein PR202_gb11597 [Eleusine coracana subsp. coracana]|uniref:STAS domain-containing protein n=1 Tax=Eleusine coracana subsp. coracana TaxID=191504 RepID=A0AAV5ENN0_ELECO|nr:hypothetical protein PR202_gb11597 [Eleusine coracana subsp. coracana]
MPRTVSDAGEDLGNADIASRASSHRRSMDGTGGYKVGVPPRKSILEEFSGGAKELFFADDDPLQEYRKQRSWPRKAWLGLQYVFPILDWGRHYTLAKFKGDLIAGLTIASLCIPQDIGYSKLANLPPEIGLYSSFVPPLIYPLMGTSKDIAMGPVAVVSLMLGTLLQNEIDPKKNPMEYRRLAFTATFFAGLTEAALGFFSLAPPVSLKKGLTLGCFCSVELADYFDRCIIPGIPSDHKGKKNKKLFWISAIAPLTSVIVSTFFVYITHADKHGVAIVKNIKKGINPPSAGLIYFTGPLALKGFKIGVVTGLIALTESIAIGRTFAAMNDYPLDGNKEMMALGTMNIVGSLTSCYITTGGFGRSAVNCLAGCKTAASNLIMSIVVLLTLLFITPLFKYTPNAILSSIIITAVIGLIDYKAAYVIWKVDKLDFLACLGAFFGVIFSSVEYGLLIAVVISLAKILLQATRPKTALLGNLPRTSEYRNVEQYPEVTTVPGVVIVKVDSAIYFTNSNYVKDRILRWLREEEKRHRVQKFPQIEFLIVELSPVVDIDTSGVQALEELLRALEKQKIQLILVNPGPEVIHKLRAAKFIERIGEDKIFLTVADAVKKFAPKALDSV